MTDTRKILIICPGARSPFVRNDAAILAKEHPTEILGVDSLPFPRKLFLLIRLIGRLVKGDVLLIWLYWSVPAYSPFVMLLSKLAGKKVIVFTGGYDTTYVPVIDWGEMKTWWKRVAQRITLRMADLVLTNSDFSQREVKKYSRPKKIQTLHHGIDTDRFAPKGPKDSLVITVCFQINQSTLIQKGLQTMIESARTVPEAKFILIGEVSNDAAVALARKTAPPNVKFRDEHISDEELLQMYQRTKVYVQVSAHEGFGIANAEAMSCECVPVVSENTALPEVVGDCGFFVRFGDIAGTADAIRSALKSPDMGQKARRRIVEHFTALKHDRRLVDAVRSVLR